MLASARSYASFFGVLEAITTSLTAAILAGAAAVLLQTKFLLNPGTLQPKFSRVNPVAGMKRVFGFAGIVEIVKSLSKLGLLANCRVDRDPRRLGRTGAFAVGEATRACYRHLPGQCFTFSSRRSVIQGIVAAADLCGYVSVTHATCA